MELIRPMLREKFHPKGTYVSYIKIAGIELLPPIITTERRIELQNDRQKAIEIERRLNFQRDLQDFFKQYRLADAPSLDRKSCDINLDDILFDNDISHINALNIVSPFLAHENESKTPCKIVPLLDENQSSHNIEPNHRKACDDSDSSETNEIFRKLSASTVELDLSDATISRDISSVIVQNPNLTPLVRSKTFILSEPSPVLLKHFKERPHTSPAIYGTSRSTVEMSLVSSNSVERDIASVSNTHELSNSLRSEYKSSDMLFQSGCNIISSTLNNEEMLSDNNIKIPEIALSKDEEETLTKLQHSHTNVSASPVNDISITNAVTNMNNFTNEAQNQTAHLQYNLDMDFLFGSVNSCMSVSYDENTSQSLVFNDILSTSTPNLIDFESDNCDTEATTSYKADIDTPELVCASTVSDLSPLDAVNVDIPTDVFHYRSDKEQRRIREKWAAGVLTAAAKGYLVRRLKQTERVQILIHTIRDALLCALSLHTESMESIQNSDIELHRRLIQQVSAACYEFYEVFFSLTTKEKMDLIALDRQRIQDKLKRPKSGSNLKLDSNRSTPQLQRRSFIARQRKSLTPTFAT